jgi:hypothetical protein
MKNFILLIVVIAELLFGCDIKNSSSPNKFDFSGTTWVMHLKGDSYNYIWLACDSTYIDYDDEIENQYYGRFEIEYDTLILIQEFEDDYHKYGSYPLKNKSYSRSKYLIRNDSIIEFISRDGNKANFKSIYSLKQNFDCKSLKND